MAWATHLPLIAILRGTRPNEVFTRTQALVNAGFNAIETPFDSPDWAQSAQFAACVFDNRALIDTGTVLCPEDVNLMVAAGDRLIVMSNTHASTIRAAVQAEFATCIGYMATTEALTVLGVGMQMLKIFPVGALGPGYARIFRAMPPAEVSVFAVSGTMPENLADYLAAGCIGAGLGSDLRRSSQPVERTTEHARTFITVYRNAQSDRT